MFPVIIKQCCSQHTKTTARFIMNLRSNIRNFIKDFYEVVVAGKRLPIRLRRPIDDFLYKRNFEKSLNEYIALPISNKVDILDIEIHMVTSSSDYLMAACAAKSLIENGLSATVVVHGDPSFTKEHEVIFAQTFSSYRVIYFQEKSTLPDDLKTLREQLPALFFEHQRKLGKVSSEGSRLAWSMKVFDFHYYSQTNKIIVLDSDTLFFHPPTEVIEWAKKDNLCLYAQPNNPNLRIAPTLLREKLKLYSPITHFNSGLLAIDKRVLTLQAVKSLVINIIEERDINVYGDECIWRLLFSTINTEALPIKKYPLIGTKKKYLAIERDSPDYYYMHYLLKYRAGVYTSHLKKLIKNSS
jgi:hypothetical protein